MKRILSIVFFVAAALNASAATWYAQAGALQQGIDRCQAGDTLLIGEGVYRESIVLKDGVSLIGVPGKTILDGANMSARLITCTADCQLPTSVENLILQNARHNQRGGAAWLRGKVVLRHCVIRGCSGLQCGGVLIKGDAPEASALGAQMMDCLVYNCSATGHYWPDAGGVANFDGTLTDCIVANSYGARYGGIHSESSVFNCTLWGNQNEYGFVDPANYISDESNSGLSRADEGFEPHFFRIPWLAADNEAPNGPHFRDPSTFAGVPETPAEEAIMLAADYTVGAPTHRIAALPPTRRANPYTDYTLYTSADYAIPSFVQFLLTNDSSVLQPKETPYCVIATINGDPRTQMAFCWFTNEGVTDGQVEIIPTVNRQSNDGEGLGKIIIPATSTLTPPLHYAISSSGILNAAKMDKRSAFRYVSHKALATNLLPATDYSYRVGCNGHWSEIGHFRTADDANANANADFTFIYMTDSHIQDQHYINEARLCAQAVARNERNARFCVFPGDFVDTGTENNSEWEWERWFEEAMKPVLLSMPLVPTAGNHDDSPLLNFSYHFNTDTSFNAATRIRPQFAGINYSFTYGDMQLIAFSMQDFWRGEYDYAAGTSEYLQRNLAPWFQRQAAAAPDVQWRVGLVHKNLFSGSEHQHDKETPLLRATMLPVMKACRMNLVLQGHDHCYEIIGPVDSTLYFIGATCGAKRYQPLTREEMEASKHIHRVDNYFDLFQQPFAQPGAPSYTRVTVAKDHLRLQTFIVRPDTSIQQFNEITMR